MPILKPKTPSPDLIKRCLRAGFLPVMPELASFIRTALAPTLAEDDARQVLSPDEFDHWQAHDAEWRRGVVSAAVARLGDDKTPAAFLLALNAALLTEYQRVVAIQTAARAMADSGGCNG